MTFFIVMFILLMQFLWKYIDDLVGKGLEWKVIAELMLYASSNLIPMALPLATLLAALMTMGNLGENNELLAMKSAGISLPRIMSPLIAVTMVFCVAAFFFSNNVLPYTNLKISTLLYSVKQQKPELAIREGVFTTINDTYSIKIGQKDQKTGLILRIMIYDHSKNDGNVLVTYADSGYIRVTNDEKRLVATLYSGNTYEEREEKSNRGAVIRRFPSTMQAFQEQVINFELEGRGLQRTDEDLFKSSAQAMNLSQLTHAKDSLIEMYHSRERAFKKSLENTVLGTRSARPEMDSARGVTYYLAANVLFDTIPLTDKQDIIESALSNARSTKSFVASSSEDLNTRGKYIAKHAIEWNRKFALSFACFVFFFIGAPLGAIIRKGGLGMPAVISVLFFVLYYIITITGEKFARELMWHPAAGMWLSSFILLPLGIFLSYKATTDSVIMNSDFYVETFKKQVIFWKKVHKKVKGTKPSTN